MLARIVSGKRSARAVLGICDLVRTDNGSVDFYRSAWKFIAQRLSMGSVAGQQAMCVSHDTRVSTAQRIYSDFRVCLLAFHSIYRILMVPIVP
jgi:hypothetical protein